MTKEELIKENTVVHCSSEQEIREVANLLKMATITALDGWYQCKENTCLNPSTSNYSRRAWYESEGMKVITAKEFIEANTPPLIQVGTVIKWAYDAEYSYEVIRIERDDVSLYNITTAVEWDKCNSLSHMKEMVRNSKIIIHSQPNQTNMQQIQVGTIIKGNTSGTLYEISSIDGPVTIKGNSTVFWKSVYDLEEKIKNNCYTIVSQPNQTTNMTQTISREGMKEIYNVACSTWQDKIKALTLKHACPFSNNVDLPQAVVDEMFKAASGTQIIVLKKYFKQIEAFYSTMLTEGQMIKLDTILLGNPATKYLLKAYGALVGFDNMGKYTTTWDTDLKTTGTKMASGSEFTLTVK